MPKVLFYLLLVAVLVSTPGNALGDTNHCSAPAEHDLDKGDVTEILNVKQNSSNKPSITYVKPKEDFEGVTVKVQEGKKSEDAWFAADGTCLPANGSWWKFNVGVTLNSENKLFFRLYCGKCKWSCSNSNPHITSIETILVYAHGPSSWNTTLKNCTALESDYPESSNNPCEKPPTQFLLWVVAGVVAVGLVVVIAVVVVVVVVSGINVVQLHHISNANTRASEPEVQETRNSLYEPLSAFQNAAAPRPT
ncbi:hypothetical protein O3P69_010410 [Scylla paramamosain]|uniref:Uncharacterized protein n=1 Tax=Scylla paramamosain TaxID=85552 RepID=A0AAW0TT61_SCYPA